MFNYDYNPKVIKFLEEKTNELAKDMFSFKELQERILPGYQNDTFRVFYKEKDGVIVGVCACEILKSFGEPQLYIWVTWICPREPILYKELIESGEWYARQYGITKISTGTRDRTNRLKALYKRYGFETEYIILSKKIEKR